MNKTLASAAFLAGLGLGTLGTLQVTRPASPKPKTIAVSPAITKALVARGHSARSVVWCKEQPARDAGGNFEQTACRLASGDVVAFDRGEIP